MSAGAAFGKVILLGEHAVVHGHPALAGAIDRGVTLATRDGSGLSLALPAWAIDVRAGDDHPVAHALAAIGGALGVDDIALDGDADLPCAAGLGSSAALSVAIARALAAHRGLPCDRARAIELASAGERVFHGNPSGVDVALAASGGFGLYRRGVGLTPIGDAPLHLCIGLSGEPRATAAMVARVAEALARDPDAPARLARLGALAEEGAELLAGAAPEVALAPLLAEAHPLLAAFGLSTAALDQLVDDALAAGALGAKLTGAGGGGAVIAIAPGRQDEVVSRWRGRGKVAFACRVGARPPT